MGDRSVCPKQVVQRNAGGIGKGKTSEERRPNFDLRYGSDLRGARQARRSPPDHQRLGRDIRREFEPGTFNSQNLCYLEREGDGVFMAGTRLSNGSDRTLL